MVVKDWLKLWRNGYVMGFRWLIAFCMCFGIVPLGFSKFKNFEMHKDLLFEVHCFNKKNYSFLVSLVHCFNVISISLSRMIAWLCISNWSVRFYQDLRIAIVKSYASQSITISIELYCIIYQSQNRTNWVHIITWNWEWRKEKKSIRRSQIKKNR